eukprot:gb/GEZN01001900.1/.p1 GENE.gb/GEZN01001900.1/~~gb/GEZN01001900.1/.p1  ORF type:complete len:872 (-),score=132.28 gb/GEZN01001900.1/:97-2712(-)
MMAQRGSERSLGSSHLLAFVGGIACSLSTLALMSWLRAKKAEGKDPTEQAPQQQEDDISFFTNSSFSQFLQEKLHGHFLRPSSDLLSKLESRPYLAYTRLLQETSVHVVREVELCNQLLGSLLTGEPGRGVMCVGLDAEWKPSSRSLGDGSRVAVVQLSFKDVTLVIQLSEMGEQIPSSLRALLEDSTVIKVGVGCIQDGSKLRRDHGITVSGCVELAQLVARAPIDEEWVFRHGVGLRGVCLGLLGPPPLIKDYKVTCSNWEAEELDLEQVLYAAADAHFARQAFLRLFELRRDVSGSNLVWTVQSLRNWCQGLLDESNHQAESNSEGESKRHRKSQRHGSASSQNNLTDNSSAAAASSFNSSSSSKPQVVSRKERRELRKAMKEEQERKAMAMGRGRGLVLLLEHLARRAALRAAAALHSEPLLLLEQGAIEQKQTDEKERKEAVKEGECVPESYGADDEALLMQKDILWRNRRGLVMRRLRGVFNLTDAALIPASSLVLRTSSPSHVNGDSSSDSAVGSVLLDGRYDTHWRTAKEVSHWIELDFPVPVDLCLYGIRGEADHKVIATAPRALRLYGRRRCVGQEDQKAQEGGMTTGQQWSEWVLLDTQSPEGWRYNEGFAPNEVPGPIRLFSPSFFSDGPSGSTAFCEIQPENLKAGARRDGVVVGRKGVVVVPVGTGRWEFAKAGNMAGGGWKAQCLNVSDKLERVYGLWKKGLHPPSCTITISKRSSLRSYEVDLDRMVQRSIQSGATRKIRRLPHNEQQDEEGENDSQDREDYSQNAEEECSISAKSCKNRDAKQNFLDSFRLVFDKLRIGPGYEKAPIKKPRPFQVILSNLYMYGRVSEESAYMLAEMTVGNYQEGSTSFLGSSG